MTLLLLAAAAAAWWYWGRHMAMRELVAAGSAFVGLWLLFKGAWQIAIPMFLPCIWMFVRGGTGFDFPARTSAMDVDEARRILGVGPEATVDEIRAAHRRLVARVHPDQGGSAELATRVNTARDILLAQLGTGYPR